MAMNSLGEILEEITKLPAYSRHQQYFQLLKSWKQVVDSKTFLQTRPLYISRNILYVATHSSPLAQTLSLQRLRLLSLLNPLLSTSLVDIRFSSAHWHTSQSHVSSSKLNISQYEKDPTTVSSLDPSFLNQLPDGDTPESAFQRWAMIIQYLNRDLPLCPKCKSPTPEFELQRWHVCAYCWSRS